MSEESQYSQQLNGSWIQWFCALQEHQYFCQIDDDFIKDNFNLYGIKNKFTHFNQALHMILREAPQKEEFENQTFLQIYQQAANIYGLIHARFILTSKGLSIMRQKYLSGKFGTCPRIMCQKQNVLPIGMSDQLMTARVKIYCPRCQEAYFPIKKHNDVDGAFFGGSFPHILLMTFVDLMPCSTTGGSTYQPKIYGFKIFKKKGSKAFQEKRKQNQLTLYSNQKVTKLKQLMVKK